MDDTKKAETDLLEAERAVLELLGYEVSPAVSELIEAAKHLGRCQLLDAQYMDSSAP